MSWLPSTKKKAAVTGRVSTLEILARFENEHEVLSRLALLITGNTVAAKRSVSKARELATHGASPLPFREQLTEWAKCVTIKAAIAHSRDEIGLCAPRYVNQTCTHAEHLLHGNDARLHESHSCLLHIDPKTVIAALDPLARAVVILRTTARASILDCALRFGLHPDTVLAANCRAMTWITEKGTGLTDKAPGPPH